jgi:hypothetical protein
VPSPACDSRVSHSGKSAALDGQAEGIGPIVATAIVAAIGNGAALAGVMY